jgi:hypothetical protein
MGISLIAGLVALFVLKDIGANRSSSVPPGIEIAVGGGRGARRQRTVSSDRRPG